MITRAEATKQILAAKQAKNLAFEAVARAVGRHQVWVTAALLGQATMSAEEANAAAQVLGLGPDVAEALQEMPMKGSLGSTVPDDPLLYRFHEITQVYGTTIKALSHALCQQRSHVTIEELIMLPVRETIGGVDHRKSRQFSPESA